jgi:glucoamylase
MITGEIDLMRDGGILTLALGFGLDPIEAAHRAIATLYDDINRIRKAYVDGWRTWLKDLGIDTPDHPRRDQDLHRISLAVIRAHEDRESSGAIIASLSTPWGEDRGDANDKRGTQGYHLVWPRDLCEAAGGLLAGGVKKEAVRVLSFLRATQMPDGHWPQNLWVNGAVGRSGLQVEETGFPILLLDLARRESAIDQLELRRFWPMVRRAAEYIVRTGACTDQDRWENERGYTPFTLGVIISALLIAAELADNEHESTLAVYLRETADAWNRSIERWLYVTDTETARRVGVPGYYARIMPPEMVEQTDSALNDHVLKSTRDRIHASPVDIVSPDSLALVRFGLRAPNDPKILDTIKVVDHLTKVETPFGPSWHRYNGDGYGEHDDGSPFSVQNRGHGRAWPLLTGERGHYELATRHIDEAKRLLQTMEKFAGDGGMLPEQVWDTDDIPERNLFRGRPTGSAMPLVWAHAEYLKLRRSIRDGRVFDCPPLTIRRYLEEGIESDLIIWRFEHRPKSMKPGDRLRIEIHAGATVHWSVDDKIWRDVVTRDTGFGIHVCDLPTKAARPGSVIHFTFRWHEADHWEGRNFSVTVDSET